MLNFRLWAMPAIVALGAFIFPFGHVWACTRRAPIPLTAAEASQERDAVAARLVRRAETIDIVTAEAFEPIPAAKYWEAQLKQDWPDRPTGLRRPWIWFSAPAAEKITYRVKRRLKGPPQATFSLQGRRDSTLFEPAETRRWRARMNAAGLALGVIREPRGDSHALPAQVWEARGYEENLSSLCGPQIVHIGATKGAVYLILRDADGRLLGPSGYVRVDGGDPWLITVATAVGKDRASGYRGPIPGPSLPANSEHYGFFVRPDWAQSPSRQEILDKFPPGLNRQPGRTYIVNLTCVITARGTLTACQEKYRLRDGAFTQAAIELSRRYRISSELIGDGALSGERTMIRIDF